MPLPTCIAQSCVGCPVSQTLHCHFQATDLVRFLAAALPGFFLAGIGIAQIDIRALVLWIVILGSFFGLIEIRVLCAHCPHYAEPARTLRCWANYGALKLWRYCPGPLSGIEKTVLWGGFLAVWGYPPVFLVIGKLWFLFVTYTLASVGFFWFLKRVFCSHCMNFACPLNGVGATGRAMFLARNPQIAEAWKGLENAK